MNFWISDIEHPDSAKALMLKYPWVRLETLFFSEGPTLDRGGDAEEEFSRRWEELLKRGFSVHGPYVDLHPGSMDRAVRECSRTRMMEAYRTAQKLGAESVVFHSGWMPAPYGVGSWLDNSAAFWREFLDGVKGEPKVFVENVYESDWRSLAALADRVEGLLICFDAGHAHVSSPLSPEAWIRGLGERIGHVHLHNNDGSRDAHRGLSQGTLDVPALLDTLEAVLPDADVVLEIPSPDELADSLAFLEKRTLPAKTQESRRR